MFISFAYKCDAESYLKFKGVSVEENPIPEDLVLALRDYDDDDDWPEDRESVDGVAAMTSLTDMVDAYVERYADMHDGTFDEESIESVHRLRRILEACIKRIDDTIIEGNKNLQTKE